jgi:hypothetical protein
MKFNFVIKGWYECQDHTEMRRMIESFQQYLRKSGGDVPEMAYEPEKKYKAGDPNKPLSFSYDRKPFEDLVKENKP